MALVDNGHGLFLVEIVYSCHVSVLGLAIESLDVSEPFLDLGDLARVLLVEVVHVLDVVSEGLVNFDCDNFVVDFLLINESKATEDEIVTHGENGLSGIGVLANVDQVNWITISVLGPVVFPGLRDEAIVEDGGHSVLSQLPFSSLLVDVGVRENGVVDSLFRHFELCPGAFSNLNNSSDVILLLRASSEFTPVPSGEDT
jgi:hypothetical protein